MLAARLNETLNALQFMVRYSPRVPSTVQSATLLRLELWFSLSCVQVTELPYDIVGLRCVDVDFPIDGLYHEFEKDFLWNIFFN